MKGSRFVTWAGLLCFIAAVVLLFLRKPILHLGTFAVRSFIVSGLLLSVGVLSIAIRSFMESPKWMGYVGLVVAIGIVVMVFYR